MLRASQFGAPISSMIASPMSSRRRSNSTAMRSNAAMRSSREVFDHPENAARAALTATSTSAAEPIWMRPLTLPVAGLITSKGFGVTGGTHRPLR